jgi:hypothetical protein
MSRADVQMTGAAWILLPVLTPVSLLLAALAIQRFETFVLGGTPPDRVRAIGTEHGPVYELVPVSSVSGSASPAAPVASTNGRLSDSSSVGTRR